MTAVVLTALGVPRELVLRDYLLSNDFHRTGYQKLRMDLVKTGIVADPELLRPIMEHKPKLYDSADVEVAGLYWHFVDLVWMFIFPLVYLMSAKIL